MLPTFLQPDCVTDTGSWCERIWRATGVDFLAKYADTAISRGLAILVILLVAFIVRLILHRLIDRLTRLTAKGQVPTVLRGLTKAAGAAIGPQATSRRAQRMSSVGSLLKSVISFVIAAVVMVTVLAEVGINIGPILASAGIAGVALGFGAQNLVKDFLAGIAMMFEDQLGVGDVVDMEVASGTVVSLGLRTTTLRGADGTRWHVRNGEIRRVGNSSQGEAVVITDLPLSYRADTAKAGEIALACAEDVANSEEFASDVISQPELQGVTAMSAEAVTIRVVTSVVAGSQWAYGRAVRGAIKAGFDQAGIISPAADWRPRRPSNTDGAT